MVNTAVTILLLPLLAFVIIVFVVIVSLIIFAMDASVRGLLNLIMGVFTR